MKRGKTKIFSNDADVTALALAKLGQSDKVIQAEVDASLSNGQINYRLRKAKDKEGNALGYRRAWAAGNSEICQLVKKDLLAIVKQEIYRELVPQFAKPTPVVVHESQANWKPKPPRKAKATA